MGTTSKWTKSVQGNIVWTNQVLDYKDSWVILRLVILRLENVNKMPKPNPRIKYFQCGRHIEVDKISTRKYIMWTKQVLDYKDSWVIMRLLILRLENVNKTPKANPRINLGSRDLSSDLRIAIPRFLKPGHHSLIYRVVQKKRYPCFYFAITYVNVHRF